MVALTLGLSGALAIIAGLVIILKPGLIRWALGLYLIITGALAFI